MCQSLLHNIGGLGQINHLQNNQAPIALISGPETVAVGEPIVLDGTTAYDPDGDEITARGWGIVFQPPFSAVSNSLRFRDTFELSANKPGLYIIGYVVSDGALQSETAFHSITVTGDNQIPTANAGVDRIVQLGGTIANLTYQWQLLTAPDDSAVALVGSSLINPTLTPDIAGEYVVELVVNDGFENSAPDTVSVIATDPNTTPIADAGDNQNVVIGTLVTLDGSQSSDAENDALTYKWSLLSRPNNSTAQLSSNGGLVLIK